MESPGGSAVRQHPPRIHPIGYSIYGRTLIMLPAKWVFVWPLSGKFGGDYLQGYIFGEVGNDRIHISAGASYEEWNGRVPRWGR